MTNEIKNVPELRFPEFEDGWKLVHLNDLGNFTSGGTPLKTKKSYWDGDIPWLTTGDINGKKIHKASNYITQEGLENSSAKLVYKESILIAMYGQGKTRGMSSILNFEAATNQACAIFQTNNDIKFMHQFLRKDYNKLRSLSNDGSQKNLSLTLLKNHQISVPKLEEQQKVGDFFSKLDRQIELEEQKLEKLEEQKKGYMQKIFSQELRFKDENGNDYQEWRKEKLKNIAKVKTGNKNAQDNINKGQYKFFDRSVDIKYLNTYDYDEKAIIYPGEGSKFLPRYFEGKYSLHQRAYSIYNIEINPTYLYNFLLLQNNHFLRYAVGSTVKSLRMGAFDKLEVLIPDSNEQRKIGDFFRSMDELVEKQTNKIELLKTRKKGFLQKMFV
ncbi:restriction endonuclease subunit S [Staphylococcus nepalensis]|uniref:restriction endonuclease subunit S n=1 Tax=Staphylococcus nepalensis TaxID=214473 RepID=UPI0024B6AA89|nr:restriction endonuclease subunit S [Staphylococcus nepalensis]MDR5649439.1 restriction endonuclease subunit S [Staphylococcus nepalensis]